MDITGIATQISELPVWEYTVWGNMIGGYATAAGAFFLYLIILKLIQVIILGRLRALAKRTETDIDDTLVKIVGSLRPPFYAFLAFVLAIQFLVLDPTLWTVIYAILVVWVTAQVVVAVQILIDYAVRKGVVGEEDAMTKSATGVLKAVAKGALWVVAILMILANLGVDITSLVAGLGIGGVAVALALQNILGDLFSSFAIYFDKPFAPGDFIVVGEHLGTVEKIGIKTTRIRALQGEEIVISNKELTSARVQNYGKMQERRIAFSFGVEYGTSTKKLKEIPELVEEIIAGVGGTRFDRAHFKSFGDSALLFEVVYYVTSSDYTEYMNIQQDINTAIKDRFEKKKISMAFPTQTVYLHKAG